MRPLVLDAARAFAAAYLVTMMFSVGLVVGTRPAEDKQAKRRTRRHLARALALQLILLPLLAAGLAWAIGGSDVIVGFLLLGAAPGGRFAPQLSRMAGAELGLSIEITLFLAKLVSFTAPVTARFMLHTQKLELDELKFIAQLLVLQLVPYLVGRLLSRRRPAFAKRFARPFELAVWGCLAAVLVLALVAFRARGLAALAGDRGWWAVLAFAAIAPALGWLLGGRSAGVRRAFAVSANARDLGLALVIGSQAFAERNIHLATFGVWLVLVLVDFGYAKAVGGRRVRCTEGEPGGAR